MSIAWVKKVELVVLPAPVPDPFPLDENLQLSSPWLQQGRVRETVNSGSNSLPSPAPLDQPPEVEPPEEWHLDRVVGLAAFQQAKHILAGKHPIHAESKQMVSTHRSLDRLEQAPQEAESRFPIMYVARSIPHSQDLARLRLEGSDRAVARDLGGGRSLSSASAERHSGRPFSVIAIKRSTVLLPDWGEPHWAVGCTIAPSNRESHCVPRPRRSGDPTRCSRRMNRRSIDPAEEPELPDGTCSRVPPPVQGRGTPVNGFLSINRSTWGASSLIFNWRR